MKTNQKKKPANESELRRDVVFVLFLSYVSFHLFLNLSLSLFLSISLWHFQVGHGGACSYYQKGDRHITERTQKGAGHWLYAALIFSLCWCPPPPFRSPSPSPSGPRPAALRPFGFPFFLFLRLFIYLFIYFYVWVLWHLQWPMVDRRSRATATQNQRTFFFIYFFLFSFFFSYFLFFSFFSVERDRPGGGTKKKTFHGISEIFF